MIREKLVYVTPDMRRFDSKEEAEKHEAAVREKALPLIERLWSAWVQNTDAVNNGTARFVVEHRRLLNSIFEYPSIAEKTVAEFLGETGAQDEAKAA